MSKEDNLKEELKNQIKRFDQESQKHKKLYRSLRYSSIALTGIATILASVALTFSQIQNWLNIAIVIITASAGAITSIEGLRKPAELWIHERNILYSLKDLQREMEYLTNSDGTITDIDKFFDKLQIILGSSQEKWTSQVTSKDNRKP